MKNSQIYVALLRGINVGGNNKIDMKNLKQSFEKIGMKDVVNYINSGNIIFRSEKNPNKLPKILNEIIKKEFNLDIKVLIRSKNDFEKLIMKIPKSWKDDKEMKANVMFLWEEVDDKSVLKEFKIKEGIDTVKYMQGEVLWKINRLEQSKSGLADLIKSKVYKKMTIRNVNTVRKIFEIIENI